MRYPAVTVALPVLLTSLVLAQSPQKTIDGGVLDHIELFEQTLTAPAETTAVIRPFDTSKANLGTGGEGGKEARQQEAQTMQREGPTVLANAFVAAVKEQGGLKAAVASGDAGSTAGRTLIVEGTFLTLDPGSRAKRYFAGFGAGKSSVEVSGSVKDADGRVLATFRQRRVGTMGMGGGDSLGKLMSDARAIGEDLAKFVTKWARGEKLD